MIRPSTSRNRWPGWMNRSRLAARRPRRCRRPSAQRLERARRGRADGDDAPALAAARRVIAAAAAAAAPSIPLGIDDVLLDALDAHRLERAVADVQRDERALDAAASRARRAVASREVQAGRRRRDRSALARVDGLIALAIRRPIRALMYGGSGMWPIASIGRRRRSPDAVPQPDRAPSVEMAREHLAVQHAAPSPLEHHARARLQLLTRVHQRVPLFGARRSAADGTAGAHEQALDGAAARHATAEQPRRKHARVVDDEQIAGAQVVAAIERTWRARRARLARSSTSSATRPARRRAPARSAPRGRSKSKSATFTRGAEERRGRSGRASPSSGFQRSPSFVDPRAHVVEPEVLDCDALLDLVPRQRRRDRGERRRPHGVDARQRLAPRVLLVVHQHAASSDARRRGTRRSSASGCREASSVASALAKVSTSSCSGPRTIGT